MGEVLIITPVKPGHDEALEDHLEQLPRDPLPSAAGPGELSRSPFSASLPPTHFARFVVIELHDEKYLMFSSRFDGSFDDYLTALAATDEAVTIWSHCDMPGGDDVNGAGLRRYLSDPRNHCRSPYVVAAFPRGVTVAQVNAALSLRSQLAGFVARAAGRHPTDLAHDFRQLPAIRRLMGGE